LRVQLELLRIGDFFFCASERQRDYWLGWLHAQKRINPHTYAQDPTLRKLIDVVPFGVPSEQPNTGRPVLKGVHPSIGENDKVIIWSGGLWDWLDPLTLIRAMSRLKADHPEFKLFFMGVHHPNPLVTGMKMPREAIGLSRELDLYENTVIFNDWTPYYDRGCYLSEADISVICHPAHIETRFSYRTRIRDLIWAGVPIITTQGDTMSDLVEYKCIGSTVPAEDPIALASAIEKLLSVGGKKTFAPAFEALRNEMRWDKAILPLVQFCVNPIFASDKGMYLTEVERLTKAKDEFFKNVVQEMAKQNARVQQRLDRIDRLWPFRFYHWIKKWFVRKNEPAGSNNHYS
jgi:glycosyltransferase involved in cell wall biosynthesis